MLVEHMFYCFTWRYVSARIALRVVGHIYLGVRFRLGPDLAGHVVIRRDVEGRAVALGKLAEQDAFRSRSWSRPEPAAADLGQAIGLVVHFAGLEPSSRRW